jgi:hypothetical protein
LNLLAPDVTVFLASDHLGESVLVSLKTVHHYPKLSIILFDDGDGSCGVITDDAGDNRELCLNVFGFCQILEQLSIVVELEVRLELFVLVGILRLLIFLGALRLIVVVGNVLTTCVSAFVGGYLRSTLEHS